MASSPSHGHNSANHANVRRGGGGPQPVLYQIDFTAVASGKRIAASKRRVRWRFGFANSEALASGQTGTACRGEEHDVTLVWSVASGKRMILADGQEVHYSNNRGSLFEFSWTMRGNHVLKMVAHASPPMSPTPGFRQYDFFVNGLSFFSFPKVFRLGLSSNVNNNNQYSTDYGNGNSNNNSRTPTAAMAESSRRSRTGPGGGGGSSVNIANLEAPGNPDEEEAYLQEAIRQSLKPEAKPKAPDPPPPPTDLLSFNDPEPSHVAPPSTAVLSTVNSDVFSAAGETIQSDPYASHTGGAVGHQPYHQSFTSLPAMSSGAVTTSNGYGAPDFASASPPGALVVAPTQSAGYLGYSLTNVPVTSAPNNPYGAAVPPPAASANPYAPTNPYAPPTTAAATNPYGAAPVPTPTNPYGSPTAAATASTNPYGVMTSSSIVPANPYGAPPPAVAETNPYGSPPVAPSGPAIPYGAPTAAPSGPTNPYGAMVVAPSGSTNPYGAPGVAVATTNPYGAPDTKSTWTPPAPISTQPNPYDSTQPNRPYDTFNRAVPPAVTPHAQQTPSSLGFGSPAPDFSGFSPALNNASYGEEKPSLNVNSLSINDEIGRDHVGETMKSAVPASFIDQTYAKLANFDNFSVESKRDAPMANPFDITSSSTVGGYKSLADMSKNKPKPAKEIMKTHAPTQAMVVSNGAPGAYGSQYGIQQPQLYGQQQQPSMYGQNSFVGQQPTQPPSMAASYNQAPTQPQTFAPYGQNPMQQQQPQYGQAPPPSQPQQQLQYGQAPPPQQQLQYGQAPPQQQLYGQPPQQGYY